MSHIDSVIGTARVIRRNFGAAAINRTMGIVDNGIVGQWSRRTKESPDSESFELYKESFDLSIIANIPCSSPPSAFHPTLPLYLLTLPRQQCLRRPPPPPATTPSPSKCSAGATSASRLPPTRPTRPKMLVSGVWSLPTFW